MPLPEVPAAGDPGHLSAHSALHTQHNDFEGTVPADFVAVVGDTMTGALITLSVKASGLTGATAASRYVGATASGAPATGTFAVGDFIIDRTGKIFICTVAGTPGTWAQAGLIATDTLWDAAGDIVYATGPDTATRLPLGTALQRFQVNAGATAPEWVTVAAASGPVVVVKSADESVTSSTTLQNDDVLLAALLANTDYAFDLWLYATHDTGSSAGIKLAFTVPTAATLVWEAIVFESDGAPRAFTTVFPITVSGTSNQYGGGVSASFLRVRGAVVNGANAGNLTLQWAQRASSATAATVKAGSTLTVTKES